MRQLWFECLTLTKFNQYICYNNNNNANSDANYPPLFHPFVIIELIEYLYEYMNTYIMLDIRQLIKECLTLTKFNQYIML